MAAVTAKRKIMLPRDSGGDPVHGSSLHPQETVVLSYDGGVKTDSITAQVVRLVSSGDCHVKFIDTTDAVASTSDMLLKAGVIEYFNMQGKKYITAIKASAAAAGTLNITIMI